MALILKNSIFYHIPKTGGQWVRQVLQEMHLVEKEYHEERHPRGVLNLVKEHISPLHADKSIVKGKLSFAFIRNPTTWYQSFWRYKQSSIWDEPYTKYHDNDFNVFMKKIMDISPGFLTQMYKEFDGVDFLGKQENLRNDLISILMTLGEKVERSRVATSPPFGATSPGMDKYDPKTLERMEKLESWIFKRYYPKVT